MWIISEKFYCRFTICQGAKIMNEILRIFYFFVKCTQTAYRNNQINYIYNREMNIMYKYIYKEAILIVCGLENNEKV